MLDKKIKTNYGFKKTGSSPFVFIAPHAAGDDSKTGIIANKLAQKMSGFLIVNNKYFKSTNRKALIYPNRVEDFNNLSWGYSYNKYLWKRKHPDMKLFFKDIADYCEQARKYGKSNKAIAVHIHGIDSNNIGIDIGAGIKKHNNGNKVFGSRRHKEIGQNTGKITLKISVVKKIKKELEKKLKKDYNLLVTIGENYSGWSKQSAIQFHKHAGRDDYAVQFEISDILRKNKKNRGYIIELFSQILKNNFV